MPLNTYYSGHGEKVMKDMTKRYGPAKGKQVFYATDQKRKKIRSKTSRRLPRRGQPGLKP